MSLFLLALCVTSVQAQIELKFDLNNRGDLVTEDHYGIFYEEINHAGDGGLYAELVRNRSFEEDLDSPICWSTVGSAEMSLTTDKLLNAVQLRALKVNIKSANAGVRNEGYWGINIVNGREYDLSFWLRAEDSYDGTIVAELQNKNGQGLGSASISVKASQEWQKYTAKISATGSDAQGYLALKGDKKGVIFLDVVSLFPPTFKGRKNGCRPDLAQMLADMHPRFMRFPGGCYIEGSWGDGQTNRFEWKKTIGPIEERPGHMNRNWDYKVTDGQGYHEYLELAEDLGANKWQIFFKVTLPLIMPGVVSGALLAFTLSLDDVVISYFAAGPGTNTLPLYIYANIKTGISPDVNALTSLMLIFTIIVLTTTAHFQSKRIAARSKL